MNINNIIPTKNFTITGQYVRKTHNELIKLQNESKQKYISFYNNLQDHPVLCKKFLFINSVFNIALRESSNFKEAEYLHNLLAEFVAECSQVAPEALKVFDNELWNHFILINTHTHDNQFIQAVKNTLSLPMRPIIEKMAGIYQRNTYTSLTQYLSGADPDLSLTDPYENFLNAIKIDKNIVFKELEQVRILLASSLPSKNIYYILKFYLAVAFNPHINVQPFYLTQYAYACRNLITNFLYSRQSIDEEIILLILDIQKTHSVNNMGESLYIEGLPNKGQWKLADYSIYSFIYELIKKNKFQVYKDHTLLKFVNFCLREDIVSGSKGIEEIWELIRRGHISEAEAQGYFLKALQRFHLDRLEEKMLFKYLIESSKEIESYGEPIINPKLIKLLDKILKEPINKNLLTLFRAQVGPVITRPIGPYLPGKEKDLFAVPGSKLWRLIEKKFLDRKMADENLSMDELAEILRNIHISTDRRIINKVIQQLQQFNKGVGAEKFQLGKTNKLLQNFLYSHAFYLESYDNWPVFHFRNNMEIKYKALINIKSSYIFDGKSKIIFVSDDRQFKDLTLLSPHNEDIDFKGLAIIDITDPEGKYTPLPINSQTIKTFPQWIIDLYHFHLACKDRSSEEKLAIKSIQDCCGIDWDERPRDLSEAWRLLSKYKYLLGKEKTKEMVMNLIRNCIGIDGDDCIRDLSGSYKLLDYVKGRGEKETKRLTFKDVVDFKDLLSEENLRGLVINLIENCISVNRSDHIRDFSTASELLQEHAGLLGKRNSIRLVINLIENCIAIDGNDRIRDLSVAYKFLNNLQCLVGKDEAKWVVIKLIENCSAIDGSDRIRELSESCKLLDQFKNLLTKEDIRELVVDLVENCSGICHGGSIRDGSMALRLLEEFGSQLGGSTRTALGKALIENYSVIERDEVVHDAHIALELLEKFGNHLESETSHHALVKILIENYSNLNIMGVVHDARIALELLSKNKVWLSNGENHEFYANTVNSLFTNIQSSDLQKLSELLGKHGNVINENVIRNRYMQTDSIRLIEAIIAYVQGPGRHRRINLPPRIDMLVNGQPLAGIAFEVHKYTDGIESVVLKAIDEFLRALKVPTPKFTISNLRDKFSLIEDDLLRTKADNALNKMLGSDTYKARLEFGLPTIAALLNLDHNTWETAYHDANIYWNTLPTDEKVNLALKNHYKDPGSYWQDLTNDQKIDLLRELRWSMWLTQSFVEAGTAYDSSRYSTSCVKGIYERLFTGFRTMHPIVDCIFVAQNVAKGFEQNIVNLLKKEKLIQNVIFNLKKQGVKGTEKYFNNKLRQAYAKGIEQQLKHRVDKNLTPYFNKLIAFGTLKSYLAQEVTERSIPIINDTLKKINDSLDNLEYMEVHEGENALTLEDYIKDQLAEKK